MTKDELIEKIRANNHMAGCYLVANTVDSLEVMDMWPKDRGMDEFKPSHKPEENFRKAMVFLAESRTLIWQLVCSNKPRADEE